LTRASLSSFKITLKNIGEKTFLHEDWIPAAAKRIAQAEGISPSAQRAPSRKNSFFQIGTLRFRVSIP
jgi:hypothetical protein